MARAPTPQEWADFWIDCFAGYAGRMSIQASAKEPQAWDACMDELRALNDRGAPVPPELAEWAIAVVLGRIEPPQRNRNTVRDDTIIVAYRALFPSVVGEIPDRKAAELLAERLQSKYPTLKIEDVRNAIRAFKRRRAEGG